jgi:integrase
LSLKAIRELYVSKKFSDATEGSRSMKYWDEFVKAVRPSTTVNEITNGQLEDYGAKIRTLKLSDKTVENRYNKVASILKFAWMMLKEHRTTIDSLRAEFRLVCRANGNSEGSPDPIDVEDFHWLYKASDEKWRAVLLLMLNTAMHPGECLSTLKGDVDLRRGQLDNRRKKTGKYRRVAILWPETIAAIQAYQALQANNSLYQDAEHLFLTKDDKPYAPRGATEYYRETLKPRAEKIAGRKLTCTLDCIRDGAQNAADDGGADPLHTAMLMGHALPGVMGSYKMRVPSKTQKSVDCIREHYRIVALSVKRSHTSVSKSGD